MGLRSDHQAGTCWARKGPTPVIDKTGQGFSCNLISTLTNRGTLRFQVLEGRFTSEVFLAFLRRLLRQPQGKVFLIVAFHSVHRARRVREWVPQHAQQLQLFYLPPYSPERNPDEFLNQDVNTNAVGRQRPRDKTELMQTGGHGVRTKFAPVRCPFRGYLHRI